MRCCECCERPKGARNAARGRRRRVPLGHAFYTARQRARGGWPRPPLAAWGAGLHRPAACERFKCPKDARNAAWDGRWRFMPMGCAIYPRIYVARCDAVWRGVSRLGRYILGYARHAPAPAAAGASPRPPLAPWGRGCTGPAGRERFECPKDTRNAPRRTAPLATSGLPPAPAVRRFGGLAVPVAQSSRWALAAPSARFAPHLRVALGLRPKCPLGTRFPPVPSELYSESGDMRGGFGSLAQARLPYAGRRLRRREACALWALARSAKRPAGVSKYKGCARPARRTPIFARCQRRSRWRSRRPAQPGGKDRRRRAFPTCYSILARASLTSSIRRATWEGVSTGWLNSTVWFTVTGAAACVCAASRS